MTTLNMFTCRSGKRPPFDILPIIPIFRFRLK
jgi:hypothetical protein